MMRRATDSGNTLAPNPFEPPARDQCHRLHLPDNARLLKGVLVGLFDHLADRAHGSGQERQVDELLDRHRGARRAGQAGACRCDHHVLSVRSRTKSTPLMGSAS